MAQSAQPVQLSPQTLEAFDAYIRSAETEMDNLRAGEPFLWSDLAADRAQQVARGRVVAQFWSGQGPVKIPHGLIHDWIAAASIPHSTIKEIFSVIQNYDSYKKIYQPEVIDSKLLKRDGNDFQIYLRLLKKKIITVVLDTDHDVHYELVNKKRGLCRSYTRRISEVENAGRPEERVLQPDTGYGFLWRLYSYWKFEERDGGAVLECRAISLTRDVPFGLGWAIEPIIQQLPKESLISTLEATRRALEPRRDRPTT